MKLDKDIATVLFVVFLMVFGLGSMYLMEHGSENEEPARYTEVEEAIESSNEIPLVFSCCKMNKPFLSVIAPSTISYRHIRYEFVMFVDYF